jgi:plasmid maintenance system antidote protein VapI
MKEQIHIGEAIKQKVKERGMKVTDFAKAIHCNRTNVYDLYKRESIDVKLLRRISKVLEYDFVTEYGLSESKYWVILEVDEATYQKLAKSNSFIIGRKICTESKASKNCNTSL